MSPSSKVHKTIVINLIFKGILCPPSGNSFPSTTIIQCADIFQMGEIFIINEHLRGMLRQELQGSERTSFQNFPLVLLLEASMLCTFCSQLYKSLIKNTFCF